jgi:hypothetical protein
MFTFTREGLQPTLVPPRNFLARPLDISSYIRSHAADRSQAATPADCLLTEVVRSLPSFPAGKLNGEVGAWQGALSTSSSVGNHSIRIDLQNTENNRLASHS